MGLLFSTSSEYPKVTKGSQRRPTILNFFALVFHEADVLAQSILERKWRSNLEPVVQQTLCFLYVKLHLREIDILPILQVRKPRLLEIKYLPKSPQIAAAKSSLQSCPTLCDPIDGSPPGYPVPGILQARTLEWVAI